jgi:Leucine-rich repeat (LRR) protein
VWRAQCCAIIPPPIVVQLGSGDRLGSLIASHNALERLPPQLSLLTGLQVLEVAHNALEQLPAEIGRCANLRRLDVSYNALDGLPPELARCRRLADLDVSDNRLHELPPFLAGLPALARLSAANNRLRRVPLELAGAEQLEQLDVTGNAELVQVHPLARGTARLVRWICSQEEATNLRATELEARVQALEAANRALEFERAERVEAVARLVAQRDEHLRDRGRGCCVVT